MSPYERNKTFGQLLRQTRSTPDQSQVGGANLGSEQSGTALPAELSRAVSNASSASRHELAAALVLIERAGMWDAWRRAAEIDGFPVSALGSWLDSEPATLRTVLLAARNLLAVIGTDHAKEILLDMELTGHTAEKVDGITGFSSGPWPNTPKLGWSQLAYSDTMAKTGYREYVVVQREIPSWRLSESGNGGIRESGSTLDDE